MKPSSAQSQKRRVLPKEQRRNQLIKATIKCVAKKGLSATTLADVTQEAGLSLGIINLHFKNKENLLLETLRYVASDYKTALDSVLKNTQLSIKEQLHALIDCDFSTNICQRNKLAIWFAFWGEAKARPVYRQICAKYDQEASERLKKLFQQAIDEGQYSNANADLAATGYTAIVDGLWLELLTNAKHMTKERAKSIAQNYLSTLYPNHFLS